MLTPDSQLNCLLVSTRFSEFSYWNYRICCEVMGHKAPSAPLGLITVAAILPQQWNFRLLDLNTREFDQTDWAWADIVCVGGMLPQQKGMLSLLAKAKKEEKFTVVGGADPTSQPEIYHLADALVLDEGEASIPKWLDSWRLGEPRGTFRGEEKPNITESPIPRYDLLDFADYFQIGVQYSRGCPFNCEFCDIIELFGRTPRTKNTSQMLAELQRLYDLGYRGSVELVDDNFIGHKRAVKRDLLPAIIGWNKKRRYPFYFNTEASMNLADDEKLMMLMAEAGFKHIFIGIESPDPEILLNTQKSQNTVGEIVERTQKLYDHGLSVMGGFIVGFDWEKPNTDKVIAKFIEETDICMAMIGLLVALPNTQLTRRLQREGRLFDLSATMVSEDQSQTIAAAEGAITEVVDQTAAGLNFITLRDRIEIYEEFISVVTEVYEPKRYFDRVLRNTRKTKIRFNYIPRPDEVFRQLRALVRVCRYMHADVRLRPLFWRNFAKCLGMGLAKFELAMRHMSLYMHLRKQTNYIEKSVRELIRYFESRPELPRKKVRKLNHRRNYVDSATI